MAHEGKDTGFRAAGASSLRATFHKISGGVLLQGEFAAEILAPCHRCLLDTRVKMPVSFMLNLIPKDLVERADSADADDVEAAAKAGSFDLEDADEELFNGKTIDLDPILREQVLLALPMRVVCREDCNGLCATCGQNLNEAKCGCEQRVVDPRLAVLKDIKLN